MRKITYLGLAENWFFVILLVALTGLFSFIYSDFTYGIAKESTLSLTVDDGSLSINMLPSAEGNFEKSGDATISINTDNFTGYSLFIRAGSNSTSLVNSNDDEIESISTAINESTFSTSTAYNNKWGYKPSQYVTTVNSVNSTVLNTDYLPAPSTGGESFSYNECG